MLDEFNTPKTNSKQMHFTDSDGNIIIPKNIRPIVEYRETNLGDKKGCLRQYRIGKLHIREFDDCYKVHHDRISPMDDILGHLYFDTKEYKNLAYRLMKVGKKLI